MAILRIIPPFTTSAELAGIISDETGSGSLVFATSPILITPALGTPTALVGTNITGTASGLTAGNVTTNANLTGHITSTGNAAILGSFTSAQLLTALTDETGTGVAVFGTSPTFTTQITTPLIYGGSAANDDITIEGTSHATKTTSYVILQPTTGNVGIGTTGPGAKLDITASTFPVLKVERTSTVTNAQRFGLEFIHTTTADMVDGFGAGMGFYIKDSAAVENSVASIVAIRDGADNIGALLFQAGTAGAQDFMTIKGTGNVGIGTTSPTAVLHLKAGTATANTAPLKFTSGTNLTVVEAGTHEYNGNHYLSNATIRFSVGGSLFNSFADVSVGGAETDIFTVTTAASTLNVNGGKITASYGGNFVTIGTESVQLKVYFAGTVIWDSTAIAVTTGTTSWRVGVELIRVSSTVVRYSVVLNTTGASGFTYCTVGELTGLTLSNTNILKLTGTSTGVGSGVGDLVGKMSQVVFIPAA